MALFNFFSEQDTAKLYVTYKQLPDNYTKIKQKLVGSASRIRYNRTKKSLRFFFAALTFIILISSAFSIVGDKKNSLIALWIIWTISLVFFVLINYYNYQYNFKNQEQQIHFFERFEVVAQQSESIEIFLKNWKTTE